MLVAEYCNMLNLNLSSLGVISASNRPRLVAGGVYFPTIIARLTAHAGTTGVTFTVPAEKKVGDMLLVIHGSQTVQLAPSIAFTKIADSDADYGANLFTAGVYYRILDGTEPATITFNQNSAGDNRVQVHLIRHATGIEIAKRGFVDSGTQTAPAITASWGVDKTLFAKGIVVRREASAPTSAPSGYPDFYRSPTSGGFTYFNSWGIAFASKENDTTDNDPSANFSMSSARAITFALAIKGVS